jgi:hypothetical protein
MSCCGDRRARLSTFPPGARARRAPAPAASASPPSTGGAQEVVLQLVGRNALSLRGPRTGRPYFFAASGSTASVHASDAGALLRTGLFVQHG